MALLQKFFDAHRTADILDAPRPPAALKSLVPQPKQMAAREKGFFDEYAQLAGEVGVIAPDVSIEAIKAFLAHHDIPVFSLAEVIAYMDDRAATESKDKYGWEWKPLRAKDNRAELSFGREASSQVIDARGNEIITTPASDYYFGPHKRTWHHRQLGGNPRLENYITPPPSAYSRTIPLHALRKVALVEKHHKEGDVAFFVSDYALAPQIEYPDPFLMAVVPNPSVGRGDGRFVIDFWDEPGFGIDKMLK